jgi:hypothetical protein
MVDKKFPRKQNKFFGGISYVTGLAHIPVTCTHISGHIPVHKTAHIKATGWNFRHALRAHHAIAHPKNIV